MRNKLILAMTVVVAMLASTGAAAASTINLSGEGSELAAIEIRATSEGNIAFSRGILGINCPVTLEGRSEGPRIVGDLTRLEAAPKIGRISGGAVGVCNIGRARMLFETPWDLRINGGRAGAWTGFVSEAQFRIDVSGLVECLITALVTLQYDETTSRIRITGIARSREAGTRCPAGGPGMTGSFNLTPRNVRIELR